MGLKIVERKALVRAYDILKDMRAHAKRFLYGFQTLNEGDNYEVEVDVPGSVGDDSGGFRMWD